MEAIPNIHAIVQSDVAVLVDHEGGRSITSPPDDHLFTRVNNFQVHHLNNKEL